MKLPFRQGISRWQTDSTGKPTFLQKSTPGNSYVDLIVSPDPTIFTFAHGKANYTVEESVTVRKAWGPFQPIGQTQYLYWDIDILTGNLSRGFTLYSPIYSSSEPANPATDQHWFDLDNTCMKVWHPATGSNAGKWVTKIRVFAGYYDNNSVIVPYPIGSQANLTQQVNSGYILKNSNKEPLRNTDGSFLTSETDMLVSYTPSSSFQVKVEAITVHAQALEYIPKFSLVSLIDGKKMKLASFNNMENQIAGIVTEEFFPGEVGIIVRVGAVRNDVWTFSSDLLGRPFFCGPTGEISLTAPSTGVVQQAGLILDSDTVYIDIKLPLYR